MAYSNVNKFIVILADKRDPYISWQNHLKRGSLGGVDCVAPLGTPIYAPDDCTLSNTANNGSGGNTITMKFADGMRDQMMHLSRFVSAGPKKKYQLVGYSGDSGSPGQPHVHWHRIDPSGRRRNPWDYFSGSTSGGGTTPIEDDMFDDTDRARLLSVFNAIFYGGPSMEDGGQSISRSLHQINRGVNAPVERSNASQATLLPADGSNVTISQAQDNADTNSMLRRLLDRPAAVVSITDEDADRIAAAIAAALPGGGGGLTKDDIVSAIKSVEWVVE
jgi:hypothetical protein